MDKRGILTESEMVQRTCKMVRVLRIDTQGKFVAANLEVDGNRRVAESESPMQANWNKCEGSHCGHWRWYRRWPWSKVEHGGKGYCGLAGKP